jgi:hypothetical protein
MSAPLAPLVPQCNYAQTRAALHASNFTYNPNLRYCASILSIPETASEVVPVWGDNGIDKPSFDNKQSGLPYGFAYRTNQDSETKIFEKDLINPPDQTILENKQHLWSYEGTVDYYYDEFFPEKPQPEESINTTEELSPEEEERQKQIDFDNFDRYQKEFSAEFDRGYQEDSFRDQETNNQDFTSSDDYLDSDELSE